MPKSVTHLTVFIASPGDLPQNEREIVRSVCESSKRLPFFKDNDIELDPTGWEKDVYSGMTPENPQTELSDLAENADIVIAIFHRKLGSSGACTRSGTVDEIERALKKREATGTTPEIKIYFREVHEDLPDDELTALIKYKQDIQETVKENGDARSASLVLGDPGTGKSALLSRLAKKLKENKTQVFSIKADMLPANIKTQIELAEKLQLSM